MDRPMFFPEAPKAQAGDKEKGFNPLLAMMLGSELMKRLGGAQRVFMAYPSKRRTKVKGYMRDPRTGRLRR